MEETKSPEVINKEEKKKIRYSNFDLLKIIAFIMVVFLHYLNVNMGKGCYMLKIIQLPFAFLM